MAWQAANTDSSIIDQSSGHMGASESVVDLTSASAQNPVDQLGAVRSAAFYGGESVHNSLKLKHLARFALEIQNQSPFSLTREELRPDRELPLPASQHRSDLTEPGAPPVVPSLDGDSNFSAHLAAPKSGDAGKEIAYAAWGVTDAYLATETRGPSLAAVTAGLNRMIVGASEDARRSPATETLLARTAKTGDVLQQATLTKTGDVLQPAKTGDVLQSATPTKTAEWQQPTKAARVADVLQQQRVALQLSRPAEVQRAQPAALLVADLPAAQLPVFDVESGRRRFQEPDVSFSKSISPSGERQHTLMAPDFSSMTEIWTPGANGLFSYKEVHRDSLNRVLCELSVDETGKHEMIQTAYQDSDGKRSPFIAYKVRIMPDGRQQRV